MSPAPPAVNGTIIVTFRDGKSGAADIKAEARRIDDSFGKRGDVAQAHVEPLPGNRMNHVGGITNERDALGRERLRHRQAERKDAAWARNPDLAELQPKPPFELG